MGAADTICPCVTVTEHLKSLATFCQFVRNACGAAVVTEWLTIDLLYWRNVKQSGAVFSSVLLLLFSLTQFSVVSVGAYLALAALSATISFRIYKSVLQAVQKTDEGHPFKGYLEMEIALSQDQISKYADKILLYSNTCMKELRRLFLVQDLVDSLKVSVMIELHHCFPFIAAEMFALSSLCFSLQF
ncbi:Reticulon-like protein [Goodea atripinnis]|uniref:Reticulon n=1 Tax=Goodea atripinnis TaxID=208336 RepID=A0ABV0PX82_9TELE